MSEAQNLPALRPSVSAGGAVGGLIPQSIDEAWRLSEAFAKAKILPRGITEPAQVMLIICGGAEVGFGPFQSLQSFYLVNNRLALWGDAIPALLWTHGFKIKEWFENVDPAYPDNMVAKCIVTRPDGQEIEGEFSVSDAKEGKLWTKEGPWQTSRKRMLKMRARAFAARDGAPDVLRGVAIREEVEDYDLIQGVASAPQQLSISGEDNIPRGKKAAPSKPGAKLDGVAVQQTQEAPPAAEETKPDVDVAETGSAASEVTDALDGDDLPEGLKGEGQVEAKSEIRQPVAETSTATENVNKAVEGSPAAGIAETVAAAEEEPIAEGYPAPDETYFLNGDAWEHDAKRGEVRRDTYKNGEPFSDAGNDKGYAIYEDHAPAVQQEPEPQTPEQPAAEDDGFPPEFTTFIDAVEAASTWTAIKTAMAGFYNTDYFKGLPSAQQNVIRGNTWDTASDAKVEGLPDQAVDASAFRLWIETQKDPNAITGTLGVLERQPAFEAKEAGFKDAIRRAVAARIEVVT